jgi:4-amino-4-deoxy-L-arabinose transferase-like glycosyltransferase
LQGTRIGGLLNRQPDAQSGDAPSWRWAGLLLLAAYALALVITLPDFGVTWDEPGWFKVGERHLEYFRSLDPAHIAPREGQGGWDAYGPLASIVIAASGALFHSTLDWLEHDTARHLGNLAFAITTAFCLWWIVKRCDGPRVALWALFAFATLPRWFGHAHSNASDMPAATCVLLSLSCVIGYARGGNRAWVYALGLALGATAAIRPQTAIFVPIVLAGWLAIDAELRERLQARPSDALLVVIAGGAGLFALWPMLWTAPIENGAYVLDFFLNPPDVQGSGAPFYLGATLPAGAPWHYPFVMTAVTTPLPVLALAAWGVVSGLREEDATRRRSTWLAIWWTAVTIASHVLLWRGNYDGVRHFLEAFGGLAWLSGIGAHNLVCRLGRLRTQETANRRDSALAVVLCCAAFLPGIVAIARLHPYPQIYYNALAGGTAGASRHFEGDYWGFSWKPAMEWLNQNASRGALVIVPWFQGQMTHYRRDDLRLAFANNPEVVQREREAARRFVGPAREVYFAFNVKQSLIREDGPIPYVRNNFPIVHTVENAGILLFEIHQLDPAPR